MSRIRRVAVGIAAAGLMLATAACTASTTAAGPTGPVQAIDPKAPHDPVTITVWSFNRQANEIAAFTSSFDRLHQAYPWLTVQFVPSKDDAAFATAVAAGQPPDVFISGAPDNVAKFCGDGTVSDLLPYLDSAGLDVASTFPKAALVYTQSQGKQCALPLLTDVYALYYNKRMFADAGITQPPRTLSELTEVAKKLTVRKPDGSVARFGFVPRSDFGSNAYLYTGVTSGSQFYGPDGKATFATDPKWAELLNWDKQLDEWYGPGQVDAFVGKYQAHTDDASNPFLTGAVAMELDGEWHVGENKQYAPNLDYGIAPMSVVDSAASTYGAGNVLGTVAYLPSASKNQAAAAFAIQQLTTDTTFLNGLADTVFNVPTTNDALAGWDSAQDPHWKSVIDVFRNPGSYYKTPSASGSEDIDTLKDMLLRHEQGALPDLAGALRDVSAKIDAANARSGG